MYEVEQKIKLFAILQGMSTDETCQWLASKTSGYRNELRVCKHMDT